MELYLSTQGSSTANGSKDYPFLTMQQAIYMLRVYKDNGLLSNHNILWVEDGVYPIDETIEFTKENSIPLTIKAIDGAKPIFDAGRKINGFQETTINGIKAWKTYIDDVAKGKFSFNQLFVNDKRASKTRFPKEGYFFMESVVGVDSNYSKLFAGSSAFTYKNGDINPDWKNLTDIEILVFHRWIEERMPIKYIKKDERLVQSTRKSVFVLLDEVTHGYSKYFIENVLEHLSEPGEFYLDKSDGYLYYIPRDDETIQDSKIYAPKICQVMTLIGDSENGDYVENITFEGLNFRHGAWVWPSAKDAIEKRKTFEFEKRTSLRNPKNEFIKTERNQLDNGEEDFANMVQASCHVPGFIYLKGTKHITFKHCTIEHMGFYGIELNSGCEDIKILNNTITDLGAGGIKIDSGSCFDPQHTWSGFHKILDNEISHGGNVFYAAVGVLMTHIYDTSVCHNNIHDFYYSGVSCGWTWGYANSLCRNNNISYNHIYNLGKGILSDMGGIYTLGMQPGTVLRNNLIHDINCYGYGGWGIYPDEGSSHLIIENNICYDFNSNCFHQHYGRENIVRNNIFVNGNQAVIAITRKEDHISDTFNKNILVSFGEPIYKVGGEGIPSYKTMKSDLNLIYSIKGDTKILENSDITFEQWQNEQLLDGHSMISDPKFADVENYDFTLAEDSPAFDMGFLSIDMSNVGVRK